MVALRNWHKTRVGRHRLRRGEYSSLSPEIQASLAQNRRSVVRQGRRVRVEKVVGGLFGDGSSDDPSRSSNDEADSEGG